MSESNLGLLLILGVLAIVFAIFFRFRAKRRRDQIEQAGASLGLHYVSGDDEQIRTQFSGYHLFRQGTSPRISSRLEGIYASVHVTVLDYLFGNITNNVTNRYLVFSFTSSGCRDDICLRVKTSKERVSGWIDQTHVDMLLPYDALRTDYVVEASASNTLPINLMAHMNRAATRSYNLSLECSQGRGIIYLPVTEAVTASMLQEFLQECTGILEVLSH